MLGNVMKNKLKNIFFFEFTKIKGTKLDRLKNSTKIKLTKKSIFIHFSYISPNPYFSSPDYAIGKLVTPFSAKCFGMFPDITY